MSDKQPIHPLLLGTTPGPWHVGGEWPEMLAVYDERCIYLTHAETGVGRDWIGENPLGIDVARANAKLIAQAPSIAAENAALADQVDRLRKRLVEAERLISKAMDLSIGEGHRGSYRRGRAYSFAEAAHSFLSLKSDNP